MSKKVKLLPILLNGELYAIDPTGNMAITTSGRAIKLADPIKSNSRFK